MDISIIKETKIIIDDTVQKFNKLNEKYYRDVLDFLNLVYEDDSKQILKIKFKKITFSEDVFILYNEIIKKYNLKKDIFDIKKFDFNEIYDIDFIFDLAVVLSNNLLEKINYKLYKFDDKYLKKKF